MLSLLALQVQRYKRSTNTYTIGASVVYPAASLPERAAERGAIVIEFNLDLPTPLSDIASITVPGKAAAALRQCVDSVLARRERGIN